ncbi:MAG TPA: MFS transporter, partial [Candidatus Binatia bacterium]|nr:MFS transporter [Candidatus Binatia bacterium]
VFPLALQAASRRGGAPALAAVSTTGYTGILAGPPVLGFFAQVAGLRPALVLVCGVCAVAAVLSDRLADEPVSAC